jgi:hypothetical protein
MSAYVDDVLAGLLRLVLEVVAALAAHEEDVVQLEPKGSSHRSGVGEVGAAVVGVVVAVGPVGADEQVDAAGASGA